MKKRLLITSIVMMLVVAVALSTATYAWFTSNATVTANYVSMTAATNTAASIGISWTNSNYGTSIAAVGDAGPFVPTAFADDTANHKYNANDWTSATIYQSGSKSYFNPVTTGVSTLGYVWHDDGSAHTDFYVNNGSTANDIESLTIKATVTGAATDFIRIAVFKYDDYATDSGFKLKGILAGDYTYTAASGTSEDGVKYYNANGEEIATGDGTTAIPDNAFTRGGARSSETCAIGTAVQNRPVTLSDTASGSGTWGTDYCIKQQSAVYSINLGGLKKQASAVADKYKINQDVMQLKIVIWMDGTALNDDTAGSDGKVSTIALNFSAVQGTFTADSFGRS